MTEGCAVLTHRPRSLGCDELGQSDWYRPGVSTLLEEPDRFHTLWKTASPLPNHKEELIRIRIELNGSDVPDWLVAAMETLCEIIALPSNWDSYGAECIQVQTAFYSLEILAGVVSDSTPIPSLVPSPDGAIQIEWHTMDIDLEIEVEPSGRISVYGEDQRGEVELLEEDFRRSPTHLPEAISGFVSEIEERASGQQ